MDRIHYYNFICRFGARKRLLDYLDDVVIPALTDLDLVRTYGRSTSYFFHDVHVETLGRDRPKVIAGQFIKNMTITRTQIFKRGVGIIRNRRRMAMSPTAPVADT